MENYGVMKICQITICQITLYTEITIRRIQQFVKFPIHQISS